MRVAGGGTHFEDAILDFEQGDIEGAAAHVVHQYQLRLLVLRVEAISEGGGSRLINYPKDVQAADGTSVFRGLPLSVIEVGRDCDHSILDGLPEERLR
mmetsp:Transcript_93965/g.270724  ORF Transcript_93965/g.270724 Transcript_93965/m.270724 type:complete len:98 (+) Transcript_93965:1349-1642(+)